MSGNNNTFPPPPDGYKAWGLFCAANKDDPICANVPSHYETVPSTVANAIFAALFSLSFIGFIAVYFGTRRRGTFFVVTMCLGNICEILGYVARVLSSKNPWEELGFLMQIVCLTIGPAFLAAGVYTCLAKVVLIYGEENSRVKAAWYTRIVCLLSPARLSSQKLTRDVNTVYPVRRRLPRPPSCRRRHGCLGR